MLGLLGSILLLTSSRGSIRTQKQRMTTLAALLVLSWVGLHLFGPFYFGTSQSALAVRAFSFAEQFLTGICVVMLVFLFWPRGTNSMLRLSGILFAAFNVYALAHYQMRHLAAIRLFYMGNGLIIGMSVPSAILLWLEGTEKPAQDASRESGAPQPRIEAAHRDREGQLL